jgi:hypothetical protein
VVLSSGFLAFAQHSGFLQAVEEVSLNVAGVIWAGRRCGGQLAGSEASASHNESGMQQQCASLSAEVFRP